MWSYGILCYEVFTQAAVPYDGMNNQEVWTRVHDGYRLQRPEGCPKEIFDGLVKRCWLQSPADRPSFDDICQFLDSRTTDATAARSAMKGQVHSHLKKDSMGASSSGGARCCRVVPAICRCRCYFPPAADALFRCSAPVPTHTPSLPSRGSRLPGCHCRRIPPSAPYLCDTDTPPRSSAKRNAGGSAGNSAQESGGNGYLGVSAGDTSAASAGSSEYLDLMGKDGSTSRKAWRHGDRPVQCGASSTADGWSPLRRPRLIADLRVLRACCRYNPLVYPGGARCATHELEEARRQGVGPESAQACRWVTREACNLPVSAAVRTSRRVPMAPAVRAAGHSLVPAFSTRCCAHCVSRRLAQAWSTS